MRTKYITMGILAHVDAGKTTLSEGILYLTGAIRKIGRVDHGNAFLDTDEIERQRGITVFSKEARFAIGEKEFTLLDTPGHSDFSSETERTLQALDYGVLVVSATDGVQAHTLTLWKLLRHYRVPTFVFVNKMDLSCRDRREILMELSEQLGGGVFADFGGMRNGCGDDGEGRNSQGGGDSKVRAKSGEDDCKEDSRENMCAGRKSCANDCGGESRVEDDRKICGNSGENGRESVSCLGVSRSGESRKSHANCVDAGRENADRRVRANCGGKDRVGASCVEDADSKIHANGKEEDCEEYSGDSRGAGRKNCANCGEDDCEGMSRVAESCMRVSSSGENRKNHANVESSCRDRGCSDKSRKSHVNRGEANCANAGRENAGCKVRANCGGLRYVFDEYNGEEIAGANETLMEEYFADGSFREASILSAIEKQELFPVFFGSALKLSGVEEFIQALGMFAVGKEHGDAFGARVYKIGRDKQGNRLTHLKVTGGTLRNKMIVGGGEKIEQIRLYNGESFQSVQSAGAGMVCAVLGPAGSYAGQGLGCEGSRAEPVLQPALSCEVILPEGQDPVTALAKLRQLAEEEPSLKVLWNEERKSISLQVMGELELEILKQVIARRFDMDVSFGPGGILYKETIAEPVIGIGHYEPLRHYAEVQLLLEPLPAGSGLVFGSLVSEDKFAKNWQRLVMTHLLEKTHRGVLIGAEITDMRISVAAGRAHPKHTEGGDFRQATYRALRQGLRMAKSVLLEPVYAFRLRLPQEAAGRALTDLSRLGAKAALSDAGLITGTGPVRTLRDYAKEVAAYTKGKGIFSAVLEGYMPCENQEEIIAEIGYDPDADLENPAGSVFCEHGSAIYVNWDEVPSAAHLEPEAAARRIVAGAGDIAEDPERGASTEDSAARRERGKSSQISAGNDELEAIFLRTYGKSKRDEAIRRANRSCGAEHPAAGAGARSVTGKAAHNAERRKPQGAIAQGNPQGSAPQEKPLYIIDGYNVIFAWEELSELAKVNIDSAREALIDLLGNYMGYKNIDAALVFDGYRLAGNPGTKTSYEKLSDDSGELQVIYTKEAQTADRFIEKAVFEMGKKRQITVVTSDRPVQMAALGDGAARMSAREFYAEIKKAEANIRQRLGKQTSQRNRPLKVIETLTEKL